MVFTLWVLLDRLGGQAATRIATLRPASDRARVAARVKLTNLIDTSDTLAPVRVSAKSDYALRALIEMASRADGRAVSAEELGRLQEIPHGFLQAILADLRRAGIVMSQRGQSGGWRMGRDAADVSVADVIRAVDGPLVSVYGLRPEAVSYNESADVLQHVWIAARRSLRDVFEQVSIQQLADGKLPQAVTSRTADEDAWQPH